MKSILKRPNLSLSDLQPLFSNFAAALYRLHKVCPICGCCGGDLPSIDLLAILQKSLDRAIFSYNFIHEDRLSGVRASIAIVHIRKILLIVMKYRSIHIRFQNS